MRNHLCLKHKILLETKKAKQQVSLENANKSSTGTCTIENYFKPIKESLERVVAELAAVDRISLNTVSTSKQLRQAFLARGYSYKLPQTVQNVTSIIISFSQTLKNDIKKMIEIKKGAGKFCSVTLDEYTSTRSTRYMNLTYDLPTFRLSMKFCLLFSPLLWKQKEHSVHVDSLLQNSGLVYTTPQSMHCALYGMRCRN